MSWRLSTNDLKSYDPPLSLISKDHNHLDGFFKALSYPLRQRVAYLTHYLKEHTQRAYIVGGSVRDYLLNTTVTDVDIEVYDIDVAAFDKLMKALGAKGVGKSFFVYKYADIDISLPRGEKKVAKGHKGFSVW